MSLDKHTKKPASKRYRAAKEKISQQKSVLQKLLDSDRHMTMILCYCGLFLLYGMSDELLGPTLIELSCIVAKPLKTMCWLFFSHDLGLLFGTLLGGIIVSRVDKNYAIMICLVCNALCITIIPILHRYQGMVMFVFWYGIFLGTPDTLSNVMLIKVFGKEVPPYLQGVHFFYGFGAFLSPLLARPFLRKECSYEINTTTLYTAPKPHLNLTYDNSTGHWTSNNIEVKMDKSSDVMYAYWIASLSHVPVIFGLCWLYFLKHLDRRKGIYRDSFMSLHNDDELPVQGLDMVPYNPEATFWERIRKDAKLRLLAVTILCSIIMFFYEGLMAMFGGYVYSYAIKSVVSMTSDQGAYLTSMYWGFFSIGRFTCVILAFLITPRSMLMGNVVGCLISSVVLAAGHASTKAVYTGTCMLGLFLSSTAPTIISMAEQYVDLTAHMTSILVISSALGELTMPVIVGQAFEKIGPSVVPGTVFLISAFGFIGYCLLLTFDNDKAYEHANAMWTILRNFWCLGCESEQEKRRKAYSNLESSSDFPSSSDSSDRENSDIIKPDQIPKPGVATDKVQPPDIEIINEDDLAGDIVYDDENKGFVALLSSADECSD